MALAEEGARLASAEKSPGVAQCGGGWTDDMFMATTVHAARTGLRPGRAQDFDVAARLLTAYAARLQRDDGLFNHASDRTGRVGARQWLRRDGLDRSAHHAAREIIRSVPRSSRSIGARWPRP